MKTLKKLAVCLILALFGVLPVNAQHTVMTGSFQFTNELNRRDGIIVLQSHTQIFDMPISENIIIANLLPGRYSLTVEFRNGGRNRQMTKISQTVDIESEKRTVCYMNASTVLSFAKEYDRNSIPLMVNNPRNHRHDFDDGRHEPEVVVPPPPIPQPVSDIDFNRLYNAVKSEGFSDTKLHTLKTASNFHLFFSCEQVKQLALLFSSDDDKLKCVKHLVPKVLDVQNLPYIQDVFSFKSTKDEYLQFLNGM